MEKLSELKDYAKEELVESSLELEGKEACSGLNKWRANIWKSYLIHFIEGFHVISGILLPFFLTWGTL